MRALNKSPQQAFTFLELVVVLVVLGILSVLAYTGIQIYQTKAAATVCLSNMRNLGITFQNYLNDHDDRWPPHPQDSDPYSEAFENYWISLFEAKYQIPPKTWLCPVLRNAKLAAPDGRILRLHYVPTLFDATKGRARLLNADGKKHPWLMEIADAHGDGALMYFPNGGVTSMNKFLRDNGISP